LKGVFSAAHSYPGESLAPGSHIPQNDQETLPSAEQPQGDFRITAITDSVGEIELTESVHPYWSSIRPPGDSYWSRVNELIGTTVKVPATTLDALVKELALKPPFLLKLDVQGAEQSALAGAPSVLADTHTIIREADIDDFSDIHKVLTAAGFDLYDITHLERVADGARRKQKHVECVINAYDRAALT
jgi:FkbM family methyltransferase